MEQTERLCSDKTPIKIQIKKGAREEPHQPKPKGRPSALKLVKKGAVSGFDSVLAVFLIGPLVIGFWRGTWGLMNIYEKHHPNALPTWESLFFSVGILLTFTIIRDPLVDLFKEKKDGLIDRIKSQLFRKFYTYSFAVVCIMHWRAAWVLGDMFLKEPRDTGVFTGCCAVILVAVRCFRNCVAPPLIVVLDDEDVTFSFPTRFRKKVSYLFKYLLK